MKNKLTIGFDARLANSKIQNGEGAYIQNLILNLGQLDQSNHYKLYINKKRGGGATRVSNNFHFQTARNLPHLIRSRLKNKDLWWRYLMQIELMRHSSCDIICSAIHVGPIPGARSKYVAIAHDLDYLEHPELYSPINHKTFVCNTERSIQKAHKIIAISEHAKQQVLNNYQYKPSDISVIYHGYNKAIFNNLYSNAQIAQLRQKYTLPETFILTVGSAAPKKNLSTLLDALSIIQKEQGAPVPCVMTGVWDQENRKKTERHIVENQLQNSIQIIGYVPTSEMGILYSAATLFAFPSIAEGFGLPIVEAMACGCPVITSNTSCMPEIAAGAAETTSPYDSTDMAKKIRSIICNSEKQKTMSHAGLSRAQMFSWQKTAQQTLEVFHSA
jgi:glycosyltransferase involved in cell wall biosynthesis